MSNNTHQFTSSMTTQENVDVAFAILRDVISIEAGKPYDNLKFTVDDIAADIERILYGKLYIVTKTEVVKLD